MPFGERQVTLLPVDGKVPSRKEPLMARKWKKTRDQGRTRGWYDPRPSIVAAPNGYIATGVGLEIGRPRR